MQFLSGQPISKDQVTRQITEYVGGHDEWTINDYTCFMLSILQEYSRIHEVTSNNHGDEYEIPKGFSQLCLVLADILPKINTHAEHPLRQISNLEKFLNADADADPDMVKAICMAYRTKFYAGHDPLLFGNVVDQTLRKEPHSVIALSLVKFEDVLSTYQNIYGAAQTWISKFNSVCCAASHSFSTGWNKLIL